MPKPVDTMEWASDVGAQKTEPSEGYKDTGWIAGDPAPAHYMNWWMNNAESWRGYFETVTDDHATRIGNLETASNALLDGSVHNDTAAGTVVRGDLIVGNSTPKWARLAKGSANQVLQMDATGTDPQWTTPTTMSSDYLLPTPSTGAFALVGSQLDIASVTDPILVKLGINRVALSRSDTKTVRAYDFDGLVWTAVGNASTIGTAGSGAMAGMTSTRIMFADNTDFQVKAFDFDGTNWALVGSGLTITGGTNIRSAAALSSTRVVITTDDGAGNMSLKVYDFNGSTWSVVGTEFTLTTANGSQITALDSSSIAYIDTGNDSLRKYTFNGSTWSLTGSGLGITITNPMKLATLDSSHIAIHNQDIDELREYYFDGSNWAQVGTALTLATTASPGLCGLGRARVAFLFPDATIGLRFYGKAQTYYP